MIDKPAKKTVFSGIQPTGVPALGNYIGALKNMNSFQDEYNCLYCVVDMHAITVRQDPAAFCNQVRRLYALYLAVGIDMNKSILFVQSHVPEHAQLTWVLNCFTYVGELGRMTQFKEKARKHEENVNAGLFDYPVLMAADVLLYGTDLVPVGDDQKQHMELCRDIAIRFNNVYGNVMTVPEVYIPKLGARIMRLQDPVHKMDKSETENPGNSIFMLDPPELIVSKFKKAMTDSGAEIRCGDDKPGITNLLTIYACMTDKTLAEAENDFAGKNYGALKTAVGEVVVEGFRPIQAEYQRLMADPAYLDGLMAQGATKARVIAGKTLKRVHDAVGFI